MESIQIQTVQIPNFVCNFVCLCLTIALFRSSFATCVIFILAYFHSSMEIYNCFNFSVWFLMSPLLIFDIRHDWMNSKALYKFITVREEVVSINPLNSISRVYPLLMQVNSSMLVAKQNR